MSNLVRTVQASNVPYSITPKMIQVPTNAPLFMVLMGTLDKCEYEAVAAQLIFASQKSSEEQGKCSWVAVVLDQRCNYSNMIQDGFITEQAVEGGWQYELTLKAIYQIYIRQTQQQIRQLTNTLASRMTS